MNLKKNHTHNIKRISSGKLEALERTLPLLSVLFVTRLFPFLTNLHQLTAFRWAKPQTKVMLLDDKVLIEWKKAISRFEFVKTLSRPDV